MNSTLNSIVLLNYMGKIKIGKVLYGSSLRVRDGLSVGFFWVLCVCANTMLGLSDVFLRALA